MTMPSYNWKHIDAGLEEALKCDARIEQIGNHCILVTTAKEDDVVQWLKKNAPGVRVVGSGHTIEIFKETGLPENVYQQVRSRQAHRARTSSATPAWRPRVR